jgi:hypothetical protein
VSFPAHFREYLKAGSDFPFSRTDVKAENAKWVLTLTWCQSSPATRRAEVGDLYWLWARTRCGPGSSGMVSKCGDLFQMAVMKELFECRKRTG